MSTGSKLKKTTEYYPFQLTQNNNSGNPYLSSFTTNSGDYHENAKQLNNSPSTQNYYIDHRNDDDVYYYVPSTTQLYRIKATVGDNDSLTVILYNNNGIPLQACSGNIEPYLDVTLNAGIKYFIKVYNDELYSFDVEPNNSNLNFAVPIDYTLTIT